MGFFQRVNAIVLQRIRQHSSDIDIARAEVIGESLQLTPSRGDPIRLDLHRLHRAQAFKTSMPAGEEIGLLMEFDGHRGMIQVVESCHGWRSVCEALGALSGTTPYPHWYATLLADDANVAISVFPAQHI